MEEIVLKYDGEDASVYLTRIGTDPDILEVAIAFDTPDGAKTINRQCFVNDVYSATVYFLRQMNLVKSAALPF